MRDKLKIAHFNVSRMAGGAEKVIFDLSEFTDPGRAGISLWGSPGFLEIVPANLAHLKKVEMDFSGKLDFAAVWRMAVKLKSEGIDLVHAHQFRNGFYAGLAGRAAGVPVIYTQHGREAWRKNFLLDRMSSGLFSGIVAVSDAVKDFLVREKKIPAGKITVIKNGIAVKRYQGCEPAKLRDECGISGDAFLIGVVGRLHEGKGHLALLQALGGIMKSVPGAHAVFVGEGGFRGEIEKCVAELGLGGAVTLLGYRSDVPELLAALDLLALPSAFEGLPLTVLEAGAAGVPVVATSVDGTVEIVEDGCSGWLVPPGDDRALEEAVIDAAKSPWKREKFAARLREHVERNHDIAQVAGNYMELYMKITGAR